MGAVNRAAFKKRAGGLLIGCILLVAQAWAAEQIGSTTAAPVPPPPGYKGETFIGHRYFEDKSGGWGWIKKPNEDWSQAVWVALKETPGRAVAPFRKLPSRRADHDCEYKIYGRFAGYSAYDPHRDERVPVFVIEGYEPLGPAAPLQRRPGPPDRFNRSRKSGASSRTDKPILTGPDDDSF